jgi:hypothetical protein
VSQTDSTSEEGALSRRTLVRLLVGFGIGVPVLIELATFLGLVEQSLFGGEDGGGGGEGSTATGNDASAVGVGDELLADTSPVETLSVAQVRAMQDAWVFTATVEVRNDAEQDYVIQLGAVTTTGGTTVNGETETARIPVGETASVTGRWPLPPGERPRTLSVVTSLGGAPTESHEVELGRIPVQGG